LSDRAKSSSAAAILLFCRPHGEDPLLTGRHFYRTWLEIDRAGLSACPTSALADQRRIAWTLEAKQISARQAGGDRRRTHSRAGAQRRMPAGRLSRLARNERSSGKESRSAGVVAQAIEAQPAFGQMKPRESECSCAEQHPLEAAAWLASMTPLQEVWR